MIANVQECQRVWRGPRALLPYLAGHHVVAFRQKLAFVSLLHGVCDFIWRLRKMLYLYGKEERLRLTTAGAPAPISYSLSFLFNIGRP